jgi:hypothetical protein
MKLAEQMRLRAIDILLESYGFVGRSVLVALNGYGLTQATKDLQAYNKLAPANMILNQTSKRWVKTENFKRVIE